MSYALILCLAMALDGVQGEPKWLWSRLTHPAVLMGRAVDRLDSVLNKGQARRAKGILALMLLVMGAVVLGIVLSVPGWPVELIVTAVLLAQKSLLQHVSSVADALRLSLHDGRLSVAMIVGRDTAQMDQTQVARAAIESAAENFSDGVIAPAFWFLVGGLPGLLIYKVTNTADSMIGYRTPRHEQFGWAAARFDDLLNLIPARLSALLIAALYRQMRLWPAIVAEARRHRSPNAGWPEAALARVLNIALAGPRSYHGEMRDFPFVNETGAKQLGPDQIDAATRLLWQVWGAALGLCAVLALLVA